MTTPIKLGRLRCACGYDTCSLRALVIWSTASVVVVVANEFGEADVQEFAYRDFLNILDGAETEVGWDGRYYYNLVNMIGESQIFHISPSVHQSLIEETQERLYAEDEV